MVEYVPCSSMREVRQSKVDAPVSNPGGRRTIIRNQQIASGLSHASNAALRQQVLHRHTKQRKSARGMPKKSTLAAYAGLFSLIITLVAIGYQAPQQGTQIASAVETNAITSSSDQPAVDQMVAISVAGSIAEQANLPIAPNVAELSVSLAVKNELAQTDDTTISKPQIVQPTADSRKVVTYTTKKGDTVEKLASRYGISGKTLKWANNLDSDALEPGKKLTIPPTDGVIYTVEKGDSVKSLAAKYHANAERIISYNDLEISGLKNNSRIIIPDGTLPNSERPGYVSPTEIRPTYGGGNSGGYVVNAGMAHASAGNRYAPGNCTWYAYERRAQLGRPVGSFWGNGGSWGYSAMAAGYRVDHSPEAGAVLVEVGSPGHVAVVESVDNGRSIRVSEMNNSAYGGYGIVNSRTISWGAAGGYTYIH